MSSSRRLYLNRIGPDGEERSMIITFSNENLEGDGLGEIIRDDGEWKTGKSYPARSEVRNEIRVEKIDREPRWNVEACVVAYDISERIEEDIGEVAAEEPRKTPIALKHYKIDDIALILAERGAPTSAERPLDPERRVEVDANDLGDLDFDLEYFTRRAKGHRQFVARQRRLANKLFSRRERADYLRLVHGRLRDDFSNLADMDRELALGNGRERPRFSFPCERCERAYDDTAKLLEHQQHHWAKEGLEWCPYCEAPFERLEELRAHLRASCAWTKRLVGVVSSFLFVNELGGRPVGGGHDVIVERYAEWRSSPEDALVVQKKKPSVCDECGATADPSRDVLCEVCGSVNSVKA